MRNGVVGSVSRRWRVVVVVVERGLLWFLHIEVRTGNRTWYNFKPSLPGRLQTERWSYCNP
jgi:hypothetical protein